jgi:hypothetical protein
MLCHGSNWYKTCNVTSFSFYKLDLVVSKFAVFQVSVERLSCKDMLQEIRRCKGY